jgi:uncharacterized protein YoxC
MAGSIYLPILSSFNPAGINAAKTSLGGLSNAFDGVKRALGVASAGFVAFRAVSETIDFGRSSIEAARDLESNLIGLESIFGSLAPKMQEFGKNAVDIGLSQNQAAKASTFIGSVLKQAGFSMDDVAGQTQKLVGIASDLAFVYNYDVSEALSGITALFRGEYDPIEKFGVAMKQSEVNAVLAANGQNKLTGAARRNAEQMARLALFMQRTSDAQGKFKESSGSLKAEQQKLQAVFANLQAEVGQALIPALVKVATAMQPLVKTLAPAITYLFTQFAGIITILSGELSNVQSNLYNMVTVFGGLFAVLKAILPFILDNALALAAFAATFVTIRSVVQTAATAMLAYETATAAAAVANGTFAATFAMTPWGAVAVAVGAIAGGMIMLAPAMARATDEAKGLNDEFNKTVEVAKKDPYKQLALSSLGYGAGLIGIIDKQKQVADGVDWSKLSKNPKNVSSASRLAGQANPASGGLTSATDEFQKMLDDLLKNFSGAVATTTAGTGKLTKATKDDIEAQKTALKELKKEFISLGQSVKPLAQVTRDIGQFEQNTIDSFDAIIKKLQDSVADGKVSALASSSIQSYVAIERKALEDLGRQRDEILKKRGLAETLIADIKSAIIGVGGLAGLLETETQQVTIATSKIVDGFVITTKRTVDEIVGGQGVLSKLTAVVAKTKAFAAQLTQLKKLGLNENLFKQIVEAGPDVGGQLATEILSGGADSVSALNTTFKQLEDVAGQVAEQTAVVMYGAGVDVANGLVNGLLAQEAAIIAAANKLADAFNAAYKSKIDALAIPTGGGAAVATDALRLGDIKLAGEKVGATAQEQANAALAAKLINTPQFTAWGNQSYINVTVNAGAGTNGKAVGQTIQSLLNQYAKAN